MSRSIIVAAALSLAAGIASVPALAESGYGASKEGATILQLDPNVVQPEPEIVDPVPVDPEPEVAPRKRRPRPEIAEPGPEPEIIEPGPEPEITEPGPPPRRRRPQPEYAEPGPGDDDPDFSPRRRQRQPVYEEPGPDFEEPPPPPRRRVEQPDLAGPSADQIERQLEARPRIRLAPSERVTIREFKRRPELRRAAPSIDIQAINFGFGSAEVPFSQYRKIENIAIAIERLLRRDPGTLVLIEGHTDAVGSYASNQILSERRAVSIKRVLVREFDIPARALDTVGYGEEYLLVPTPDENWRNRRVTLRSIDEFVRY